MGTYLIRDRPKTNKTFMDYFSLTIYTSASYGASVQSLCKCYTCWQILLKSLLTLDMEDRKGCTSKFTAFCEVAL